MSESDEEVEVLNVPTSVSKDEAGNLTLVQFPALRQHDGQWFFKCAKSEYALYKLIGVPFWDSSNKDIS